MSDRRQHAGVVDDKELQIIRGELAYKGSKTFVYNCMKMTSKMVRKLSAKRCDDRCYLPECENYT